MEKTNYNPKDDQITNDDDAVTNKDGDNNLEQGEQPTIDENKTEATDVPTVTPDNEGDPGLGTPPVVKGEQSPVEKGEQAASNKGQGPKGENL